MGEDGEEVEWRVPWWWVDAGKSMMLLLLAAIDEGLGAGLFGLVGDDNDRLRELLGMPDDLEIVGVVTVGHEGARARPSGSPEEVPAGSRSRRSSAGNTGSRSRRRPDRRHLQPVLPFSPAAGTASGYLERRSATRRSCSSGRRPATAAPVSAGIPFTSERQLTGGGPAEASATIVHRVLAELGLEDDVLLWNVVPTHPHEPDRPYTNRRPTRDEVEASSPFSKVSRAAAA